MFKARQIGFHGIQHTVIQLIRKIDHAVTLAEKPQIVEISGGIPDHAGSTGHYSFRQIIICKSTAHEQGENDRNDYSARNVLSGLFFRHSNNPLCNNYTKH